MEFDTARHGRASVEKGTEAVLQAWEQAQKMQAQYEGISGEFVPKDTIYVNDDINPREGADVDMGIAREYAALLLSPQMPPLRVQRDTFTLIDGKHRLSGSYMTEYGYDCIRIEEVDVDDEELVHEAFKANAAHGRPLLSGDRILYLKRLIDMHGKSMSLTEYQRATGLARPTVVKYRDLNGLDPEEVQEKVEEKKARKERMKKVVPESEAPPFVPPAPVVMPEFEEPEEETEGEETPGTEADIDRFIDEIQSAPVDAQEGAGGTEDLHVAGGTEQAPVAPLDPQGQAWWAIQVLGREDAPESMGPDQFAQLLPKHLHNQAVIFIRNAKRWLMTCDEELTFRL